MRSVTLNFFGGFTCQWHNVTRESIVHKCTFCKNSTDMGKLKLVNRMEKNIFCWLSFYLTHGDNKFIWKERIKR